MHAVIIICRLNIYVCCLWQWQVFRSHKAKHMFWCISFWSFDFLSLHAWLCQQSSWNRNSSVVRPSVYCVDYLGTLCTDFFQILVVASPGPYAQTFFILFFLFVCLFVCLFLLLFFFCCCCFFFIFENDKKLNFLRIFFVFVNMGPYGSENFKTLLLLPLAAKSLETFPEFSS